MDIYVDRQVVFNIVTGNYKLQTCDLCDSDLCFELV